MTQKPYDRLRIGLSEFYITEQQQVDDSVLPSQNSLPVAPGKGWVGGVEHRYSRNDRPGELITDLGCLQQLL
jgi:hypothetical protein